MTKKQEIALYWMDKKFHPDRLDMFINEKIPNSVFYKKDGILVIECNIKTNHFWFDYGEVWLYFKRFFNMSHKEICGFLLIWLEKTFNLVNNQYYKYEKFYISVAPMNRWRVE